MKRKLAVVFGILCAAAFLQGTVSVTLLHRVRQTERQLADTGREQAAVVALQLRHFEWLQDLTMAVYGGAVFTDSAEISDCEITAWRAEMDKREDPALRELAAAIDPSHRRMHEATLQILDKLAAGDHRGAADLYENAVLPNVNATMEHLAAVSALYDQRIAQYSVSSARDFRFSTFLAMCIALFCATLCAAAMVLLHQRLSPPLRRLIAAADRISRGDPHIGGLLRRGGIPDELDHLARAIQGVADTTLLHCEQMARITRGDLSVQIASRGSCDALSLHLEQKLSQDRHMLEGVRHVSDTIGLLTDRLNKINHARAQLEQIQVDVAGQCGKCTKSLSIAMADNRKSAREQQQIMRDIGGGAAVCRRLAGNLAAAMLEQQRLTDRVGNEMLGAFAGVTAILREIEQGDPQAARDVPALRARCGEASAKLAGLLRQSGELMDDTGFTLAQVELALHAVDDAAASAASKAQRIVDNCHMQPLHPLPDPWGGAQEAQALEQLSGELHNLTARLEQLTVRYTGQEEMRTVSGAEAAV